MAHLSENVQRLTRQQSWITSLEDLDIQPWTEPAVFLYHLPWGRTQEDAEASQDTVEAWAAKMAQLPEGATVCILTTPVDAAALLPLLQSILKFQLWVAVKTVSNAFPMKAAQLPQRHAALLVLTRYRSALKHNKTRIAYSYCPACGKTTKDYGGKKHTYHEYGTLASDVWRDIEIDPAHTAAVLEERLCDLFGHAPYQHLHVVDLRNCSELMPQECHVTQENKLPLVWESYEPTTDAQLINRDCLDALKEIADDSIDFCFTDPPYNLQKTYDQWDDALETVEYFQWCDQWLSELHRVLKPGRTLAVLNIPQWAVRHYQYLHTSMRFQNWIAWDGLSFPVRLIMPAHYGILCVSKGNPRPLPGLTGKELSSHDQEALHVLEEGYCLRSSCVQRRRQQGRQDRAAVTDLWTDVHRLKHNSRRVDHPCQLPPLLMQRLYALFTQPSEMVLDCFNGAGTSTLVAQQMQRQFIGIELSSCYHQLALERHRQLICGENPFGKNTDDTPKAKNSRVRRMTKQRYEVSKKQLQLEVRRIAQELGRIPNRDEVAAKTAYPMQYFDDYFASWGEVCAAARTTGMSELPPEAHRMKDEPQLTLL